MAEWTNVDGYVALNMMRASAELAHLNERFERLQHDIALGQASDYQISVVRRHCNKLSGYLGTALFGFGEAENAAKAADKLQIVK